MGPHKTWESVYDVSTANFVFTLLGGKIWDGIDSIRRGLPMTRTRFTETTCTLGCLCASMAGILAETGEIAADPDDCEPPQLSGYAMAALQEFYTEQEERQWRFEAGATEGARAGGVAIEEDWV